MAWRHLLSLMLFTLPRMVNGQESRVECWRDQSAGDSSRQVPVTCGRPQILPPGCDFCDLRLVVEDDNGTQLIPVCTDTSARFNVLLAWRVSCMLSCAGKPAKQCKLEISGAFPPSRPSPPSCFIPSLGDIDRSIHCKWDPGRDTLVSTKYTLHWEVKNIIDYGHMYRRSVAGDQDHAVIERDAYISHSDMTVWVIAQNLLGSQRSEDSIFNTANIIMPPSPVILRHVPHAMSLEIFWEVENDLTGPCDMMCEVQHRPASHSHWTKLEEKFQASFLLDDTLPDTAYEFRVRCCCSDETSIMSDWSKVYTALTPEEAPTGVLDVWLDCVPAHCYILWKEMVPSQARGWVHSYCVTMELSNGTRMEDTKTVAQWGLPAQGCRPHCRIVSPRPLGGVKGLWVSLRTSAGVSPPAPVALPATAGGLGTEVALNVTSAHMLNSLAVSWPRPLPLADRAQEYVLQYRSMRAKSSTDMDWLKIKQHQNSANFTGTLRNHTAYNVSLFAVLGNRHVLLGSAIGYTTQGVPPAVSGFSVAHVSHAHALVNWKRITEGESEGHVLSYTVGLDHGAEVTVSADQSNVQLSGLQASQMYEAWIRAQTEAGPGPKTICRFSTTAKPGYPLIMYIASFVIPLLLLLLCTLACRRYSQSKPMCFENIPDPVNSSLFKQFQHSLLDVCAPLEPSLKISELEVLHHDFSTHRQMEEEHRKKACWEEEQWPQEEAKQHERMERGFDLTPGCKEAAYPSMRTDRGSKREQYSHMIDTEGSEEEEDCWLDKPHLSDYERHFMPTLVEV